MRHVGGSAWNGTVEMERTGWTGGRIVKGQMTGLAVALNVVCEGEGMTKDDSRFGLPFHCLWD